VRVCSSAVAAMRKRAQRPACATTCGARGDPPGSLTRQWQKQQLQLLPIPGETTEEQAQEFLRFLDALAERVTMLAPPLALAADVPASRGLSRLRTMLEAAGDEVDRLCQERLSEEDLHFLA